MWDYDVDETSRIFTIGDWLRLDEVAVMIVFAGRARRGAAGAVAIVRGSYVEI